MGNATKVSKWRKEMGKLTQEDWIARIEAVMDPDVRSKVARLVWWDFFSQRPAAARWAGLDPYLVIEKDEPGVAERAVCVGLLAVGYIREVAVMRCMAPELSGDAVLRRKKTRRVKK